MNSYRNVWPVLVRCSSICARIALSPRGRRTLEVLFYLGLAIWSTWPLGANLVSGISQGTESVATVPLFNLWTLWWNADRLAHGLSGYWNAPIFHPATGAFSFSEPQPTHFAVAPVVWLTGQLGLAVNLYQLGVLVLNGVSGAWVCRILLENREPVANPVVATPAPEAPTPDLPSAPQVLEPPPFYARMFTGIDLLMGLPPVLAGAMMVLLPYVHWQLGVLQLGPVCGMLWTIGSLVRFTRHPTWWPAVGIGGGFASTYWLCANHGLFFSLPLAAGAIWLCLGRVLIQWRFWAGLGLAAAIAVIGVWPIVHQQRAVTRSAKFDRPLSLMTQLSAHSGDYAITPWKQWIPTDELSPPDRRKWWFLGVGTFKTLLAGVGAVGLCVLGFRRGGIKSALFLLVFLSVAFLLSHGPGYQSDEVAGLIPWDQARREWPHPGPMAYRLLVAYVPGFGHVRNVFRFCVFVQITLVLLSGIGLITISRLLAAAGGMAARRIRVRFGRAPLPRDWAGDLVAASLATLLGLAATFEVYPARQRIYTLPEREPQSGWTHYVRDELPKEAVVLCLPFVSGHEVGDYLNTTLWMYWQTEHHHRMANGYSGFFPEAFLKLSGEIGSFPSRTLFQKFVDNGVTHLVIHRSAYTRERLAFSEAGTRYLRCLYSDPRAAVDVYALTELKPTPANAQQWDMPTGAWFRQHGSIFTARSSAGLRPASHSASGCQ